MLRAIAEKLGVSDPVRSWMRFTGKNDGRQLNVEGQWQAWCASERPQPSTDDAKARDGPKTVAKTGPWANELKPLTREG